MSTYQLKIHTRDLAVIGGKLVSHSGYDLIETKSDKSVIVHSLDLMNYNGKIYITQTTKINFQYNIGQRKYFLAI